MKKLFAGILTITMIAVWTPIAFAVQDVNGAAPVALSADGILNGVSLTAQGVNETTLTIANGESVNTNALPAGAITSDANLGIATFAGTSTVSGTVAVTGTNAAPGRRMSPIIGDVR